MIKLRFFVHPHFIIKYYLLKDTKEVIKTYHFKGSVLDVGCGEKPYRRLFKETSVYTGIDFKNYSKNAEYEGEKPDIYFNNEYKSTLRLPFHTNSFDHIVSFQVLEHNKDPEKMIREMVRIIKPSGLILLSTPFIWSLHELPNDYQRFTQKGLATILEKNSCTILQIKEQGSICSVVSTLLCDYLIECAQRNKILYALSILFYLPFLIFSYCCFILDKVFVSKKIFSTCIILAKKD